MAFKNREGRSFIVIGDKKPIARHACVVNRRVAPSVGRLGAGRAAGFYISAVRIEQAKLFWVALTGAQHAIKCGQILGFFNYFFSAAANRLGRKRGETFQPKLFNLVEYLGVAIGLVILVVIINAKQREDFIERINVVAADLALVVSWVAIVALALRASISWPSCGR